MAAIKGLWILFILTTLKECNAQVWHCPFNTLCTCQPLHSAGHSFDDSSLAVVKDVSCISVPFLRMPDLPSINMSNVRVIGSGMEVLERGALGGATINSLNLDSNRLALLDELALESTVKTLKQLDLSYNSLPAIPIQTLHRLRNLEWLNLDSNRIINAQVDWKELTYSISNLFLGKNGISHLPGHPDYSYANFQKLTWLNLESNFISSLEPHQVPIKVNILNLSKNIFKMFPTSVIASMGDLSQLILRDNYIEMIPNGVIKRRSKLDVLDLGENDINVVENMFSGSIYVRDLFLDNNKIRNIPGNAFKGINCNRINLSHNKLDVINDRAFYGLGNSLEFLDLSYNNLTRVPRGLSTLKKLKKVSLEGNRIRTLSDDVFPPISDIMTLTLSNNELKEIPNKALRPLKSLSQLFLNYNKISNLTETDFSGYGENIDILEMMNNGIEIMNEGSLRNLKQLKELNLSFNNISKLGEKCLVHLSETLESFEMSFGLLSANFPEAEIKPLRSLVWLSLDYNQFSNVSRTALYNFGNLKYVNLEGNQLSDIPDTFFHANVHKSLQAIRLSYNKLKTIKSFVFSGLKELQTLVINDNEITTIRQHAFENLQSVLSVVLSENKINYIAPKAFINIKHFLKLDIHGNELKTLSLNIFQNVSQRNLPMTLNISRNHISTLTASHSLDSLFIKEIDMSYNEIDYVPIDFLFSIKQALKKLNINHNKITSLDHKQFSELKELEILEISFNNISECKPSSFIEMNSLQILNLSFNDLEIIHSAQFKNLAQLRILDLSFNRLKSIPNDAFEKTKLEQVILSHNELFVAPTAPLMVVSYSLRLLDLSYNKIEHIDSSTFANTPLLTHLNLCHNKLTYIPDNIFRSIVSLISLEFCSNKLQHSNIKELFHFTQKLNYLNLANASLKAVPVLSLPHLAHLNLSSNLLSDIGQPFIDYLPNLRVLDLSKNNLSTLNGISWNNTRNLEYLDISSNPIKIITRESFRFLENLKELNVQNLQYLERFDTNTLYDSKFLVWLKVQTWPNIEKYRFRLERILSKLKHLRKLSILVTEPVLTDQLGKALSRKIKYFEITGYNLTKLEEGSLSGLELSKEVTVHIHGTSISSFPTGFFSKFQTSKLTLDLRDNKLTTIHPDLFYSEPSLHSDFITTKLRGGINIMGNKIKCNCDILWFGHWLRRHLRESLELNRKSLQEYQEMFENTKGAVCYQPSGEKVPILLYKKSSCSNKNSISSIKMFSPFLLIMSLIAINSL